jgi:hypothetical protein
VTVYARRAFEARFELERGTLIWPSGLAGGCLPIR